MGKMSLNFNFWEKKKTLNSIDLKLHTIFIIIVVLVHVLVYQF